MTPPQEKFARLVAEGMDHAKAYRECYPKSRKWANEAVARRAHRLANDAHILPIVEELRRRADDDACMECRELRHRLTRRIRALDESGDGTAADFCRLADSLARISGWNQPDAVAVAAVVLTPEERARRWREMVGLPEPEQQGDKNG